jgi:hypothetical protein
MSRLSRARHSFTFDRLSGPADLAVKFAGIVVAVGAIAVVFFGPSIELTSMRQAFIDRSVLRRVYKDAGGVPPVVLKVANQYNRLNTQDLMQRENTTIDKLTASSLCRGPEAELLVRVFPGTRCSADDVIVGHGHYWERLLIRRIHRLPGLTLDQQVALAETAVDSMYEAQYRTVRAIVSNTGHARAVNVNLRVPSGYSPHSAAQSISPFTLGPGETPVERFYRTATGVPEVGQATADPLSAAVDRFGVDWERDQNAQVSVVVWVAGALFVIWLLIFVNDSRLRARREAESASTSS